MKESKMSLLMVLSQRVVLLNMEYPRGRCIGSCVISFVYK